MKAIVQDRYGSPDVLELRDVDKPVAADNEVLARVHAVAVNARDWHVMRWDPEEFTRNGWRYDVVLDLVRNRSLTEAPEAIRYLEVEHARAKGVITV
jgi:hypothetical protein